MFNVGGPEIVVILLVALVILGPDQLPKAMRTLGNVMSEIRKVSNGFQNEMRNAMDSIESTATPKKSSPAASSDPPQAANDWPTGPDAGSPRSGTAETMEEADVTEVVARNPARPESPAPGDAANGAAAGPSGEDATAPAPDPSAPSVDPVDHRPRIDPADRAAG